MGKDQQDYARYRLFVLSALPGLKFLDSSRVTVEERAEAKRVGHLMKVAKPEIKNVSESSDKGKEEEADDEQQQLQQQQQQQQEEEELANPSRGKVSFGVSRYVYYGKQSEGNRFITNDEL